MDLYLEPCGQNQLSELVEISKTTFSEAFEAANNPEDFNDYVGYAFNREKLLAELLDADTFFYFVYRAGTLVGYFKLNQGNSQTDIQDGNALELERIYVVKEFQGQKIGEWMMEQIKKMALDRRKKYIWLGVWEYNPKAIKFYERFGFVRFGTHPYYIGKDKQTDWLMRYDV